EHAIPRTQPCEPSTDRQAGRAEHDELRTEYPALGATGDVPRAAQEALSTTDEASPDGLSERLGLALPAPADSHGDVMPTVEPLADDAVRRMVRWLRAKGQSA
ncbi:MAG: hypothetical protein VBE63_30880, partial [Lamprobacter sp.]|uniref:hypothetical protein n=1 Tax=Lamprobacter sp. TaxID=3100796 RepID=UPI002B25B784